MVWPPLDFRSLEAFDTLEKILEGKEYLVNNEFSAADIAVGFGCNFLKLVGVGGSLSRCFAPLPTVS